MAVAAAAVATTVTAEAANVAKATAAAAATGVDMMAKDNEKKSTKSTWQLHRSRRRR